MKKLLLLLLTAGVCSVCLGQSTDTCISAVFGEEYLQNVKNSNPGLYRYFDGICQNGIRLEKAGNSKYSDAPVMARIPVRDPESPEKTISIDAFVEAYQSSDFNPLMYNLAPTDEYQVFRLAGTSYLLFIAPRKK